MCAVMLAPSRVAAFRRTVRDDSGKALKVLVFEPRKPQLLEADELAAVRADIGSALVIAAVDEDGFPTGKPADDQTITDVEPQKRKRK